jgi:integrase
LRPGVSPLPAPRALPRLPSHRRCSGHVEDRNLEARLFADSGADALRTSIAKACKAAGVPLFSPHDLRHRRISLLHLRGEPWARIGEFVRQRNLAVTANTYTHVLADEKELDYVALLGRGA